MITITVQEPHPFRDGSSQHDIDAIEKIANDSESKAFNTGIEYAKTLEPKFL